MTKTLQKFLGVKRWSALADAWYAAQRSFQPVGILLLSAAFAICFVPVISIYLAALYETLPAYLPTLAFGLCTLIAFLLRRHFSLPAMTARISLRQLSLTHTAVALGCLPAVVILLLDPGVLADRHDVVQHAVENAQRAEQEAQNLFLTLSFVLFVAAWAAVTEEVLFRGLLLSAIRRLPRVRAGAVLDGIAILFSAMLFALAHVPTWGWSAAIALFGLGCGFGLAYVVTNERLGPVMGYHFLFDVLSIGLTVLL